VVSLPVQVIMTVRLILGSATEFRWLPVTVTFVPPLKTTQLMIFKALQFRNYYSTLSTFLQVFDCCSLRIKSSKLILSLLVTLETVINH